MSKELIIQHQRLAQIHAEDAVFYLGLGMLTTAKYFQEQAARNAEIAMSGEDASPEQYHAQMCS